MPHKPALKAIGYHYNSCGVIVEAFPALRRGNKTVRGVKGVKPISVKSA